MFLAHHQKPPGSPLWAQPLQNPARVRFRTLTVAFGLAILSLFWLYGNPALIGLRPRKHAHATEWRTTAGNLIPPKIWQIILPKKMRSENDLYIEPESLDNSMSWVAMNPGYAYTLMGEKSGLEFVLKHFSHDTEIIKTYMNMPNVGMKSDLLRYLILSLEGGVYTDLDTVALRPIDDWVPQDYRDKVRLIVGIEFDQRDGASWFDILHPVQFCQWTVAASASHPLFRKMTQRVIRSLEYLSETHETPMSQLRPSSTEVMNATGQVAWTETVFAQLQEYNSSLTDYRDFSYLTEPRLIGDVLVLPIDGFGMGQQHSNSTNDGSTPPAALLRHLFYGSWRGD